MRHIQPPHLLVLHLITAVSCLLTTWQVSVSKPCLHLYTSDPVLALSTVLPEAQWQYQRERIRLSQGWEARSEIVPPTPASQYTPFDLLQRRGAGLADPPLWQSWVLHGTQAETWPVEPFRAAECAQGNRRNFISKVPQTSHSLKWAPPCPFLPVKGSILKFSERFLANSCSAHFSSLSVS